MHIIFLLPHLRISGGVKVILRLSEFLCERGINVTVCSKKPGNLLWLNKKHKFDIVETKNFSKYTLPSNGDFLINYGDGISFGALPDIPHILYLQHFGVHNYEREVANLKYPYTAVFTVSKWLADIAVNQFHHKKVYIIPPAIDSEFIPVNIKKSSNGHTLGCLYHEAEFKNIGLFLAAANKIFSISKNIRILLISAKKLKEDAFDQIICPYSYIVDPPQNLLPAIYSSTDVWISPSFSEGFGLCPVEAMACGVPTVITKSFGLDEYLNHGKNCLLVPSEGREHMVSAINAIINDPNLRDTIIKNGLNLAASFTWKKTINMFIAALNRISPNE